jgi:hypothetical protein
MSTETPKVYSAINAVSRAMSKEGIAKGRKNQQQGYAFRGIDDVFAALAPHLASEGLCILPRVIDRTVLERETKAGGNLFYTTLKVEFDFVAVADGSKHTVCTVGEAMDSGDKSSNKAMSAAYKYACFQTFCIPTEGDNDADGHTHEVAPRLGTPVPSLPPIPPLPAAWDRWTLEERGMNRAAAGVEALRHWFEQLSVDDKKRVAHLKDEWKAIAAKVATAAK